MISRYTQYVHLFWLSRKFIYTFFSAGILLLLQIAPSFAAPRHRNIDTNLAPIRYINLHCESRIGQMLGMLDVAYGIVVSETSCNDQLRNIIATRVNAIRVLVILVNFWEKFVIAFHNVRALQSATV